MAVRTTRVDPAKNMARWYEIDVQPRLFGEFTV
jgi:predicted DNA-binding WGR domain protein